MRRISFAASAIVTLLMADLCEGDLFGSGASSFEIEFAAIGNPGNPPDANPNPAGAVPYEYRIGKYEVSEQMIANANALGGLGITTDTRGPDFPVTSVTWYEAARFVNWLNTSTGSVPAYKFDASGNFQLWNAMDAGYDPANLYRNRLAKYFLPSLNEWHKAAYYDPVAGVYYDYPTGSDSVPDGIDFVGDPNFDAVFFEGGSDNGPNTTNDVGLTSPYGTFAQGGNAREWIETAFDRLNSSSPEQRSTPGGGWTDHPNLLAAWNTGIGVSPQIDNAVVGFRISSVIPEPSSIILLVYGWSLGVSSLRRRTAVDGQKLNAANRFT